MDHQHHYVLSVLWTGNLGDGTSSYRAYSRDHQIAADGKPVLLASSDPAFRGDRARYNPEEMLLASLSSCHMLWFLHLASTAGIVVTAYEDRPEGIMAETSSGGGRFTDVTLRPRITLTASIAQDTLEALHHQAHDLCFIANSVNFPVRCMPTATIEGLTNQS